MPKKLFVGGLSWNTRDLDLREAFEAFGEVSEVKVVTHRDGEHEGKSRGFGFVSFLAENDAQRAKDRMDGTDLDGRSLKVDWANDKPPRH